MKKTIRKNLPYIIALFVFYFLIPHIVMSLPGFSSMDPKTWTGLEGFALPRIYWYCVWIGVPLSGGVIALVHVLRGGKFSPILVIEAALAMVTYLFRIEARHVLILSVSVLIILLLESFALLEPWENPASGGKRHWLLTGAAANRKQLALLCFCSVIALGVIQVACGYLAEWQEFMY